MNIKVKNFEGILQKALTCDKLWVAYGHRKDGITIFINCPGCIHSHSCEARLRKYGFTKEVQE